MWVSDLSDLAGGRCAVRLEKAFAVNLRQFRKAKGLKQWQLAELVELGPKAISDYEVGRTIPSFETIHKLAGALGIPPAALFGGGMAIVPSGPRMNLLHRINATLSSLNEAQLVRVAKMLEAFAGG